ncbi:hypothetical protein ACIQ1D_19590 [Lysinibacillus xylanilyticus]|uniref:hypothetical protein n=1 Tax=Lysinibacillus xylanilyticus TaxID=582475 RepID=UPI0038271E14
MHHVLHVYRLDTFVYKVTSVSRLERLLKEEYRDVRHLRTLADEVARLKADENIYIAYEQYKGAKTNMVTIQTINNKHAVYTFDLSGGYRAIHKIGMSKCYDSNAQQLSHNDKIFSALHDALDGIEVVGYRITDKKYNEHVENGKKYKIEVDTIQGSNNEEFTMSGYFIYNGTYDISNLIK